MPNQPSAQPKSPDKKSQPGSFFMAILSGLLAFLILGGVLEGVFRLDWADKVLPMRSVGNFHTEFETKWFKLDDYVRQNGGVDVILLGNSMVNTGIDPEIVAAKYKELTGENIRIFNFGVEGLTVAPLSDLAQILEAKYHPSVIILFTEMRDYIAGNGDQTANKFLSNAWIQQQLGHPTFEGFLESNSSTMQHLLPLRYWSRADFPDTYILDVRRLSETTSQGYEADRSTGRDIYIYPDPQDPAEKSSYDLFKNYAMDPSRIESLKSILSLRTNGTKIIVTEFPVYPTYYAYLESESVRQDYLSNLSNIVAGSGNIYLPAVSFSSLPLFGRVDNHHLNFRGAKLYSNSLAVQLANLCLQQHQCLAPVLDEAVQP
jgi:hypothetical protein